jgi:hypothetical protein
LVTQSTTLRAAPVSSPLMKVTELESALQKRVLKRLEAFGGFWSKTWGGPYARPGVFDIVGCLNGCFVAIELKAPGKYKTPTAGLTPAQWNYLSQVRHNGGYALVEDNEERLFQALKEIANATQ